MSLAASEQAVLSPGRDAQQERERRQAPFSPWGLVPWIALAAGAAWGSRRAVTAGHTERGRRLLAVTGLLIGGGVSELALRVTSDQWTMHVKVRDGCYHSNPRGYFQEVSYLDDPRTQAWCAGPLRDVWASCEAQTTSDRRSVHRIMALGDSFTDGVGVFARDTWPAQLEGVLGAGVSVVNCGKAASYTSHIAKRYLAYRDRHAPQTVVYGFVLNDVPIPETAPADGTDIAFQLPNREAYSAAVAGHPFWGPMVSHSAIGRLVGERLIDRHVHHDTLQLYADTYAEANGASFDEAMELIVAMNELVTKDGGRLIVAVWPLLESLDDYPFEGIHERITAALNERTIPTLDLLETFRGRDTDSLHVHATDHHPNEIAQRIAAEAIADELRRRDWLPVHTP